MTEPLDIDALKTLRAVAQHGGVTRAADVLALSQSAVSHKLRRLEKSLNCRLLVRRTGGPLLTPEAERLLGYAERILTLHAEAMASLGRQDVRGAVRLGITEDTTSGGLARVLARFARLYPHVAVKTHVDQSLTLERQLNDRKIDLAVIQTFGADVRPRDSVLDRDRLVWAGARDFSFDPARPLPFVAFDPNCFFRRWAYEAAAREGFGLTTVMDCASIEGVRSAVRAGLGVSVLNARYVDDAMQPLDLPPPPDIAYIVRAVDTAPSPVLNRLIGEIEAEFSAPG